MVLSVSILVGCSSDEPSFSRRYLIGDWKLVNASGQLGGIPVFTIEDLEECDKDDIYSFLEDNTFQILGNGIKCDEGEDDVLTDLEWSWGDGKMVIMSDGGIEQFEYMVLELKSKHLKLSYNQLYLGSTLTITATYMKLE
jgi:hypothetical protein